MKENETALQLDSLEEALDLLEDCWFQFAYEITEGPYKGRIVNGGLSTLEWLEEFLTRNGRVTQREIKSDLTSHTERRP